jgi:Flp pilus assembly protein TadD
MDLGKIEQAVKHFRKAIAINPKSASARMNLKQTLRKWGSTSRPQLQ